MYKMSGAHAVSDVKDKGAGEGEQGQMRVAFHNLGCKVNSYELDIMRQKMAARGYETVPFSDEADIYVINTCTVTNIADRKSRQMLHRAKKRNPNALVVAVGCYVETDPGRVGMDPAIDLAIGNNKKGEIADLVEDFLSQFGDKGAQKEKEQDRARENAQRRTLGGKTMEDLTHRPRYEDMQLTDPGHTRVFCKIQDGCNQFCTYCIIPYARGRIRSRRPEEVIREITRLAQGGTGEVVLTGIHLSSYGLDWGAESGSVPFDAERSGANLLELIGEIAEIPGIARIRLGSLEPRIITEQFVRPLSQIPQVCPHFHLSLQSGCDETLRRMNRRYTTAQFMESVQMLRQYWDRPAVTTDVIVGFPGETIAEFEETERFLRQVDFYEMHVFKYSARRGTVAAKMPVQIPEAVKNVRSDRLLAMTQEASDRYRQQFIGQKEELYLEEIAETEAGPCWRGHTMRYVEGFIPTGRDDAPGRSPLEKGQLVKGYFAGRQAGTQGLRFALSGE